MYHSLAHDYIYGASYKDPLQDESACWCSVEGALVKVNSTLLEVGDKMLSPTRISSLC